VQHAIILHVALTVVLQLYNVEWNVNLNSINQSINQTVSSASVCGVQVRVVQRLLGPALTADRTRSTDHRQQLPAAQVLAGETRAQPIQVERMERWSGARWMMSRR